VPVIIEKIGKDIEGSVYKTLDKLGYAPSRKKIFIKPNIVNAHKPNAPYITNPRIVGGIIDYLVDKGVQEIVVGEGVVGKDSEEIFRETGYTKLCKSKKVKLISLHNAERIYVKLNGTLILLPKIVFETEYINVSKLKTHVQTTVSLGLKNQKGLLNIRDRKKFHKDLHSSIANLANVIRPHLSVIDATNGVEGNGPGRMGREIRNINLLICGTDFLLTDYIGAMLMGISPDRVNHLKKAKDLGISLLNDAILGEDLESVKMDFMLPTNYYRIFNVYYWWSEETCSGCSSLLGEVKNAAFKSPVLLLKIFYYGFFKRLDFVMGNIEKLPNGHGKVVCIGNCTKNFAAKNKLPITLGCPPLLKDIFKYI
jgi:uncharacterized protein (DUF362 family)